MVVVVLCCCFSLFCCLKCLPPKGLPVYHTLHNIFFRCFRALNMPLYFGFLLFIAFIGNYMYSIQTPYFTCFIFLIRDWGSSISFHVSHTVLLHVVLLYNLHCPNIDLTTVCTFNTCLMVNNCHCLLLAFISL